MDRTKTHTTADKGEPDVFTCPPPKTEKFVGKNENCPNCTKRSAEIESGPLEELTKGEALIKRRKNSPTQNSGLMISGLSTEFSVNSLIFHWF